MRLNNKVALVTGGSRGIGRAIAVGLVNEGAKLIVNYRREKQAAASVVEEVRKKGGAAIAIQADVGNKSDIDRMVDQAITKYGRIDILVNNAGIAPFIDFFDVTEEIWDRVQAVNARGIFFTSQAVAKVMVEQKIAGRIINVTSISGEKATNPLQVPYCTSKGAANMLTKVMALALGRYRINVNAVLPGTVETDINREVLADEAVRKEIIGKTPLKSLGRPEDIVGAVIYLASDEADWVTGALVPVDGGYIV